MAEPRVSSLLIDEAFATGDDQFVTLLRQFHEPKKLASIADRWKNDPRPWVRHQIFAYLELPLDASGHNPLVKRLFKHAEQANDDELMAAFLVAFDRLVRRQRKTKHHYDWRSRSSWTEESLVTKRNTLPIGTSWRGGYSRTGRLFSYHTRYYLRRRAWRYFRRMGFKRPSVYCQNVARALVQYRDEDLAAGENILDNWGLIHACFGESELLAINASTINLKEGKSLADLSPARMFPQLWQAPAATSVLLDTLLAARSRLVRVWATMYLRQHHKAYLAGISVDLLLKLLDHDDPDIQQFGAEILETAGDLARLPIATWLVLLKTRNLTALETIVQVMKTHVTPDRLDPNQCITLATAEAVPVARLGLQFLKTKSIRPDDLPMLMLLARARAESVGGEIAAYALGLLGAKDVYDADRVVRFFDSLNAGVRGGAWAWLSAPESTGRDDPALWSRLIESPYDDLRFNIVTELQRRLALPGADPAALAQVWASVLFGIHRGGRYKLIALRQISRAVQDHPEMADRLMPVLAVAIRSVRPPEARAGLAAIVSAVQHRPDLAESIGRFLPELNLTPAEAIA